MVYSRRCESRRGGTTRCEERRGRPCCGGGRALDSPSRSLALGFSPPLTLTDTHMLPPSPPSLSLSLSVCLSPRRGSRLKTRSKSRRRVASSRFGDSKERSFLFPSLAVACLPGSRFARSVSHASPLPPLLSPIDDDDGDVGASALLAIRRETSGLISRTLPRSSHPFG